MVLVEGELREAFVGLLSILNGHCWTTWCSLVGQKRAFLLLYSGLAHGMLHGTSTAFHQLTLKEDQYKSGEFL